VSESADFFTNPSETVRLRDFKNRNNTTQITAGMRAINVCSENLLHASRTRSKLQVRQLVLSGQIIAYVLSEDML